MPKAQLKSYRAKLLDPRWQKRRLEILSRDNFTCQECGATDKTLHVHHRLYRKGYEPWDYNAGELVTVCEECHDLYEVYRDLLMEMLFSRSTMQQLFDIYASISTICTPDNCVEVLEKQLNADIIEHFERRRAGVVGG